MTLGRRIALGILVTVVVAPMILVLASHLLERRATLRYPASGGFLVVEGTWLHVLRRGEGPAVVLLHGNPGSVRDFRPEVVDELARRHLVIAIDRPGHGHSERPDLEGVSPEDQAWLVEGVLREIGVESALVVGHSWGGALSLLYALDYPARVAGLVLLGTRAYPSQESEEPLFALLRQPYVGGLLRRLLPPLIGGRRVTRGLGEAYAPEAVRPEHLASARALWSRPGQVGAMIWDRHHLEKELDVAALGYRRIDRPVEIVVGAEDPLRSESERLALEIPEARLEIVPGAGHHLPQSRPAEVVAAVRRALGRANGTDAGETRNP